MHRDKDTLFDIIRAAHLILQFKGDLTPAEFRQDAKTYPGLASPASTTASKILR